MPVLVSVKCHKCNYEFDTWANRDNKGFPNLHGCICESCGSKNTIHKNWSEQKVNPIIPPAEDGQINRFEYSYTTEDGKKISKKMDPKMIDRNFKSNSKGF